MGGPDPEAVGPPMHVVDLTAVTTLPNKKTKGFDDVPVPVLADGSSVDIPSTARFDLRFDRYLLPSDAVRRSVCLQPNTEPAPTADKCTNGIPLKVVYDPVRRVASYYLDAESTDRLAADNTYVFTAFKAASGGLGFRAFDGVSLEATKSFRFRVVEPAPKTDGTPADIEQARAGGGYCPPDPDLCFLGCDGGAEAVLRSSCGDSCHGQTDTTQGSTAPAVGLQLRDLFGIENTAKDKVAHETEVGGRASTAAVNPPKMGVAMPIVASSDAGNSYLLYKLLANPETGWEAPLADGTPSTLAPGETDRLRRSLVVGMPMPAQGYAVSIADVELLSQWISSGAEIPDCARILKP